MASSSCSSPKTLLFIGILLSLGLSACQGTKSLTSKERRSLHELVEAAPAFSRSFTGFALYDPEKKEWLYQKNVDKYFTPASNTKILTLYTALEILGDTFPLLHYELRQDSLIFWGTGNPAFLDPTLPLDTDALNFLQEHEGPLFFTNANFSDRRYGSGWAWDDFPYYYQPEKAGFPVYGNFVHFSKTKADSVVNIRPRYFQRKSVFDPTIDPRNNNPVIIRDESHNLFRLNPAAYRDGNFQRWVPFRYSPEIALNILQDTLSRNIYYLPDFTKGTSNTLYSLRPDTLYGKLMQQSDNFIAEQLLLMCGDKLFGEMNTSKVIAFVQDSLLAGAPDRFEWVDGSGLSRYNLFTPRSIVFVLERLYRNRSQEWLFGVFPAGGRQGTISNWYGPPAGEDPFVFAKTGSLRHRHCLSGYLRTRSGKILIFSFMHNNFTGSSNPIKEQMDQVLRWIYAEL